MNPTDKIILSGLANSKTSLGEVFRRYVECFQQFSNPDVFDINIFSSNSESDEVFFPKYTKKIDHNIRFIHTTIKNYLELSKITKPRCSCCRNLDDYKKIGYFVWESSKLEDEEAEMLSDFDEIWTASNYCKQIFSNYISSDKIRIIKHPIPFPLKNYSKFEKFTILIMGNISSNIDRKNIMDSLSVAKTVKSLYPETRILFKTFTISDTERSLISYLNQDADITVIDEYYSSLQVQELIAKSHVLLSMHRSEGFGLCLAEAIPLNTIPLATNYSGNTDFMSDPRLLIDYDLVDTNHNLFLGQWANPKFDDAVDKLVNIIENYGSTTYNFSNINDYSFENVTKSIKQII